MNRFAAEQARRNRSREGAWQRSANHRCEVTRRVLALLTPETRLCVLGAGNCDDLDLGSLGAACREVHLVDIDGEALDRGVQFQLGEPPDWLHLHSGIDVSGIFAALAERSAVEGLAAQADNPVGQGAELVSQAAEPAPPLVGPFDVVVSTCLVSQLIEVVVSAVPEQSPWRWPLLLAVRSGHLRLCSRLTAPGGRWLLVSDFVSSASCPRLTEMDEGQLANLIPQLVAQHNFFHGLNPLALPRVFADDPVLRELIADVKPDGYWLWRQRRRTYAVVGLECQRTAVISPPAA